MWNKDPRMRDQLLAAFADDPNVVIGDNEPYTGQTHNHTADTYGTDAGLPHISIEIRQDLIDTRPAAVRWADVLAKKLAPILGVESALI